jgi:hypothetical protein
MISILYRFYLHFGDTEKDNVGSEDKNGPKRCRMRRLGTRYVPFFFFVFFYILTR